MKFSKKKSLITYILKIEISVSSLENDLTFYNSYIFMDQASTTINVLFRA